MPIKMGQKICSSLFLLFLNSLILLFAIVSPAVAQSSTSKKEEQPVNFPLYNGLTIGVDLLGAGSKVLGSDFLSGEVSLDANLKNRFFPIVELGFGTTDTRNEQGTHYKSSAPYFRLGMNYNTMYKKNNSGFLYVGFRYALSSFSYDVSSTDVYDPIWGTSVGNINLRDEIWGVYTPSFNHEGLKGTMHWAEFLVGIQVHIYKEFHMGWSVRMKYRISVSNSEFGDPWYVPGFGKYDSSSIGLTYSIIYKLPFK